MKIYIINNTFHYEMENLTRVFFPNEKIEIIKCTAVPQDALDSPYVATSVESTDNYSRVSVQTVFDSFSKNITQQVEYVEDTEEYQTELERTMAVCLYKLLSEYTGLTPPWGILTGVRPIKLFRKMAESMGTENAKRHFRDKFLVSEEKVQLAEETEKNEQAILRTSSVNSYSLYVSIPFCPSRCSYCSFISQATLKAKKLIEPYVELLCRELEETAKILKGKKLKLETVYIGGGTPTTLNAQQLERLIATINRCFPMEQCREFTVEAGRPDTITEDKLKAILNGGADRISINPQTMNDTVLEAIGRKHTAQQTIEAYRLARAVGFNHINMDLIVGLPKDNLESFENTLNTITELDPESITVHTLSMKRSSNLTIQGVKIMKQDADTASAMHTYCKGILESKGYHPYYLYRQSRMVGNLENIGYSKPDRDGLYNVFIMDETHTILGCGAGAVTKLKNGTTGSLSRVFNYKYPDWYVNDFDEILRRKQEISDFFNK